MKRCSRCKQIKEDSDFYKCRQTSTGLSSACKAYANIRRREYCSNPKTRAKRLQSQRSWTERNRDKFKVYNSKAKCKKYGLTPARHRLMYLKQNGCCAMCGEPVPYADIKTDHNHNTGEVRGLLCCRCNNQIAIFDNYDLLAKAKAYLTR